MVFSSITFLYWFLPATIAAYFAAPKRARNVVLLVASLTFYTWGGGDFVLVLAGSIVVDYALGRLMGAAMARGERRWATALLVVSIVHNVGLLGYFKYFNFFVDESSSLLGLFGRGPIEWASIVLPLGISFFVFEKMSYTIDLWRGGCAPQRNLVDFALFVSLFPRSIAGPIVRFAEIEHQLRNHPSTLDGVSQGVVRFSWGLVKKVVIADSCAKVADAAFAVPEGSLNTPTIWLGLIAYGLQLYFDFSGYSDMAIGLAKVFGFRLPENFDRPYSAVSITDFWRRWHMTLSRWFRDYVYFPMGGSRRGSARTVVNLMFVFLLIGFWHGAAWTFVLFGAYHGLFMLLERFTGQRALGADPGLVPLRRAWVALVVISSWALFRADSIDMSWQYFRTMFSFDFGSIPVDVQLALTTQNLLIMAMASLVALLPAGFSGARLLSAGTGRLAASARLALLGVALPYAAILVASGSFSPFLYFRF